MSLSLVESQALTEIAGVLYDFLPGKPHPYANPSISFKGAAIKVGVGQFWTDGSKLPSLNQLLDRTLTYHRDRFCDLILEIVRLGVMYRKTKSNPINREEIRKLNELLLKVQFKIPDLWDPMFIDSLPTIHVDTKTIQDSNFQEQIDQLKLELIGLTKLNPQQRGFAFEKFLNHLFAINDLAPRGSFRLVGEQIDGSIQIGSNTYLIEAKWQDAPIPQADLLVFHGKVHGKSTWSRGLFISNSGFSEEGLVAFSHGRPTNIIGLTGQDLFFILNGDMALKEVIERKTRRAAEDGLFYISVFDLKRHST
jgi:hypothetical protein